MNIDNIFDLAKEFVIGGYPIRIEPYHNNDEVNVRVLVSDIPFFNKNHIEYILEKADKFDCNVIIKNNVVIFE